MASSDGTLLERIESHPQVLGGKPIIRGTRISVALVVNFVAHGITFQEIIREYPQLTEEDLRAALLFAGKVTEGEGILDEAPAGLECCGLNFDTVPRTGARCDCRQGGRLGGRNRRDAAQTRNCTGAYTSEILMLQLIKQSLLNQFESALSTLGLCLEQCPEEQWDGQVGNYPFWHVAYHALFYGDFYLSPNLEAFEPREFHRENYEFFDRNRQGEPVVADVPYDRETLLVYLQHCRDKAALVMEAETEETLLGPSGFWWYKVPRAEFWIINARHVHHHAAQLSLYLRNASGIAIPWVGSGWHKG